MAITASTLVSVDTLASKSDLWTPPAIFLPNWSAGVKVHTSFSNTIETVMTAAEVRTAQSSKPSRSIEFQAIAMGKSELALLRSVIERAPMARTPVPLYCDQVVLPSSLSSGATVVPCDSASRRFFVGGRIVICSMPATTVATTFEFGIISAVSAGNITLAAATGIDHPAGSLLFPVIEADLVPQLSSLLVTDEKATASLTYLETVGAMTLDPLVAVGTTPPGVSTYDGVPIFATEADWSGGNGVGIQAGVVRIGETTRSGLFNYIETHGSRFKASMSFPALSLDRATAFSVLGFCDSRGGRQKAFLAINPSADYTLSVSPPTGTTIVVVAVGSSLDWTWRTHIALLLGNGTFLVRKITNVVRAGSIDTVTVADAWPTILLPILRTSSAFLMRFDSDETSETWSSDQAVSVPLQLVELLEDDAPLDITIPPITIGGGTLPPSAPGSPPPPPDCICDPDVLPPTVHIDWSGASINILGPDHPGSTSVDAIPYMSGCQYIGIDPSEDGDSLRIAATGDTCAGIPGTLTGFGAMRIGPPLNFFDAIKCKWIVNLPYDSLDCAGIGCPGTFVFEGGSDVTDPTGTYIPNNSGTGVDCTFVQSGTVTVSL